MKTAIDYANIYHERTSENRGSLPEMRAAVCTDLADGALLKVTNHIRPISCSGEIIVKVEYAGLGFQESLISKGRYQFRVEPPFIPGTEVAGTIVDPGNSGRFRVGDKVLALCGIGGLAEYVSLDPSYLYIDHLPPTMTSQEGAGFTVPFGTAIHAFKQRIALQKGEFLLLGGAAGGCGLAAVQVAKLMGANVIACVGDAKKADIVAEFGADHVIVGRQADIRAQVMKVTNGRGVDAVYDLLGGVFFEQAVKSVAWCGRYAIVGFASGNIPQIGLNKLLLRSISLAGVSWGEASMIDQPQNYENFRCVLDWHSKGLLKNICLTSLPLTDINSAMTMLSDGTSMGRVTVDIGG